MRLIRFSLAFELYIIALTRHVSGALFKQADTTLVEQAEEIVEAPIDELNMFPSVNRILVFKEDAEAAEIAAQKLRFLHGNATMTSPRPRNATMTSQPPVFANNTQTSSSQKPPSRERMSLSDVAGSSSALASAVTSKSSETRCSGKGTYIKPTACLCNSGYGGDKCQKKLSQCEKCTDRKRGICVENDQGTGSCLCSPEYKGDNCEIKKSCKQENCNGNGVCFLDSCICNDGFTGDTCQNEKPCPQNCNDKGVCKAGTCYCSPGVSGEACDIENSRCSGTGENGCSGHGICALQRCFCDAGYSGETCATNIMSGIASGIKKSDTSCKSRGCNRRGICYHEQCICEPGFSGPKCEELTEVITKLIPACEACHHGVCELGKCICDPGWSDIHCDVELQKCPNDCFGNGICKYGFCFCNPKYRGEDCSIVKSCVDASVIESSNQDQAVESGCNGHGICKYGECFCNPDYQGNKCQQKAECKYNCSYRGVCIHGQCKCIDGYTGNYCSELVDKNMKVPCDTGCSGHGTCFKPGGTGGRCMCQPGWEGLSCETEKSWSCPKMCHLQGVCSKWGTCDCFPGFFGDDCGQLKVCPNECSKRGVCQYGKCFCLPGYGGDLGDCSIFISRVSTSISISSFKSSYISLSNAKHNEKYIEPYDVRSTPSNVTSVKQMILDSSLCYNACYNRGICYNGDCQCEPGYSGMACENVSVGSLQCVNNCAGRPNAYATLNNSIQNISPRGLCVLGKCFCHPGFSGSFCEEETIVPCLNDCNKRGECVLGNCYCDFGYSGKSCEKKSKEYCKYDCHNRGLCFHNQCKCAQGYYGDYCENVMHSVNEIYLPTKKTTENKKTILIPDTQKTSDTRLNNTFRFKHEDLSENMRFSQIKVANDVRGGIRGLNPTNSTVYNSNVSSISNCPEECENHGRCALGKCWCNPGYTGISCQKQVTCGSANCSNNGQCHLGRCVCYPGWSGIDCATEQTCSSSQLRDCSNNGICKYGKCWCFPGYTGDDCSVSQRTCPEDCNKRGICIDGRCYCIDGFTGNSCKPLSVIMKQMIGRVNNTMIHKDTYNKNNHDSKEHYIDALVLFKIFLVCILVFIGYRTMSKITLNIFWKNNTNMNTLHTIKKENYIEDGGVLYLLQQGDNYSQ